MRFPAGRRLAATREHAEYALSVVPGLLGFQGHFPGDPILPGVVQVDWAVHFGAEAFGPLGPFQGVDQLKFRDLVRPGEELRLVLALDPSRASLRFSFLGAKGPKASGILRFAGQGA